MTEPLMRGRGDRDGQGPARDYTTIGEVTDANFVRLPKPGSVFAARSARFADLASGHPLSAYLIFLSRLSGVQHAAQGAFPHRPALSQVQSDGGMPPLSKRLLSADEDFALILDWLVQHAAVADAPEAAEQSRARLEAMAWDRRLALAGDVFDGAYPADELGECVYVAAALQVHLTRLASGLDPALLQPLPDGGCPACGSGPVASMIVGWAEAGRARYCCCSVCATLWNHVRIKCTACGGTSGISYYLIEEQTKDLAVETCTVCRSYIKHVHQHRNIAIEPVADDIASFGLDILVQQQDFRRATANPLMVVA